MKTLRWLIVLSLASPVWSDVVRLKDGQRLEGQVKRSEDGWTVTGADGKVTQVAAGQVAAIEATGSAKGNEPGEAESRLQSLRAACENMTDAKAVLERYQQFTSQDRNAPVLAEAQKDVAAWTDRLGRGLVRVGAMWMTPRQRDELHARSGRMGVQAGEMIKQGRLKEAERLLDEAIAADPDSAAAAYVRGVLSYQQEQIPAGARVLRPPPPWWRSMRRR